MNSDWQLLQMRAAAFSPDGNNGGHRRGPGVNCPWRHALLLGGLVAVHPQHVAGPINVSSSDRRPIPGGEAGTFFRASGHEETSAIWPLEDAQ